MGAATVEAIEMHQSRRLILVRCAWKLQYLLQNALLPDVWIISTGANV